MSDDPTPDPGPVSAPDPPDPGNGTIPAELLERLRRNEPSAWAWFLGRVWSQAHEAIHQALVPGNGPTDQQVRRLVRAYRRAPDDLPGALQTALTSFRGHFLDPDRPAEVRTMSDCALELIRITFRHWRRRQLRDKRMGDAAALGAAAGPDGEGPTLLDQVADDGPGPDEQAALSDFLEKMREEARVFCQGASETNRRVVFARLSGIEAPSEIKDLFARELGTRISTAQISKILGLFEQHVRQRLRHPYR